MNSQTERLMLQGIAGQVESLRDVPEGNSKGIAIICHPHPLFGGTMDNKVVQTLARAFVQTGWTALRFNFRGIGRSAGAYDEGRGEADDLRELIKQLAPAGSALAVAGFSFGSFVASQVLAEAAQSHDLQKIVMVGTAASRFSVANIPAELHEKLLVVHGEQDDTVPLSSVMDWARPQVIPVTVVPGGGHFFHGQLPLLRGLVARHLNS
ncbi:alpha/beta family hydrolase [Variovorax sp. PCZ-1]|uniref:alpha/beta hydrolase n=1 Tax=Variovorax sp. PCZ-1 TaxID=2835533 RepID=UPI001BCE7A5A|nr:alpha/beta family hydrolase [Variovorax sp. PCZ-1]MBS7809047.1 alpha/beta hydrolase [Variovorax sp. PCZ-1]